jgi:hypothetical protein
VRNPVAGCENSILRHEEFAMIKVSNRDNPVIRIEQNTREGLIYHVIVLNGDVHVKLRR